MGWITNFAAIFLSMLVVAQANAGERTGALSTLEFQQRGARLRVELERNYQNLRQTGEFKSAGNDVSAIVRKYLPAGVSLTTAEEVLRSAGFDLEPLPAGEPPNNRSPLVTGDDRKSSKMALLATLILARRGVSKMTVELTLLPKTEATDQYAVKAATIFYRGR